MNIKNLNYKKDSENEEIGISENEKRKIDNFQRTCIEMKLAFDARNQEQLLSLSNQFIEVSEDNKIYPPKFIDETDIINSSGLYINSFHDPDFIKNMLCGLLNIFQSSSYALQKFISINPSQLLLTLLSLKDIDIRRKVYLIILSCCKTEEGAALVLQSPILQYCFTTLQELFQLLSKETQENSPYIDISHDILNILIEIVDKSPPEDESIVNLFLEICKNCFESEYYYYLIMPGIRILGYLSRKGYKAAIVKSNLFSKVMSFLNDDKLRNSYVICIKLAAYFAKDNNPILGLDEIQLDDEIIGQIPIQKIISLFIQPNFQEDEEFIYSSIDLFINIVIRSSDHLSNFTNRPDFTEFMNILKKWIGIGSMETKLSASWLVWNMLYIGMIEQKIKILETGVLDYLEDNIEFENEYFIINVLLKSIERIIKSFRSQGKESVEPVQSFVLQMRGFVRDLYYNDNTNIHNAAQAFLNKYYPDFVLY